MEISHRTGVSPLVVKVLAAVVVGLSIGSMVPPDAVAVPLFGPVSGFVVGGVGLVVGSAVYLWVPSHVSSSGCGCAGDCGCS